MKKFLLLLFLSLGIPLSSAWADCATSINLTFVDTVKDKNITIEAVMISNPGHWDDDIDTKIMNVLAGKTTTIGLNDTYAYGELRFKENNVLVCTVIIQNQTCNSNNIVTLVGDKCNIDGMKNLDSPFLSNYRWNNNRNAEVKIKKIINPIPPA